VTDTEGKPPVTPSAQSPKKTSFAGDVAKLVSGTTIAQFLGILIAPILTRLFAPEAFGVAALFTSITSILGVIACMRYELSIMLPKSDTDAANLLGVSLLFATLIALLTVPVVLWGRAPILRLVNEPLLGAYLWMVPVAVFILGVFHALNYWNSRTRRFGRLSIARVTSSVTTATAKVGGGMAGYATGGTMIAAGVVGQAVATGVLAGQIWRDERKLFRQAIRWREMRVGLKRYRRFPLLDAWSALLNTVSWQLPALMLSAFFSSTVVGYYALGFRILHLPMDLVGQSIGQVFFQRAAEARVEGKLAPLVGAVFHRLVLVSFFPMLLLAIIGKDLFMVVFGATWAEAGVYAQILALWAFFYFVSSPISTLFSVLERQDFGLKVNAAILLSRGASLAVGGYMGDARIALALFAGTGVVLYGYRTLAIMATAGVRWREMWGILAQGLAYSTPFALPLLVLSVLGVKGWLLLSVALAAFTGHGLLVWRRQPNMWHIGV
jgi:lipopolysaccharide exporter